MKKFLILLLFPLISFAGSETVKDPTNDYYVKVNQDGSIKTNQGTPNPTSSPYPVYPCTGINCIKIDSHGSQYNVITSPTGQFSSLISPYGYLRVSGEGSNLLADDFDTPIDTNQWTVSTIGTGSVTQGNSYLIFSTGTTAGNSAAITSIPTFNRGKWGFNQLGMAIQLNSGNISNVDRFWGFGNETDGIGFELNGNILQAVIYQAGVAIYSTTLNKPNDGMVHSYVILTRVDQTYWFIDGFDTPVAASNYLNPNVATLPISAIMLNTGTPSTAPTFNIMSVGLQDSANDQIGISDSKYSWRKVTVTPQNALKTDSSATVQPTSIWPSSSNAMLDAFKRFRVSETFPLWDAKAVYTNNHLTIDNILVGGGTATYIQSESSVQMTVTTASGDKVTRRSRQWIKYHPGSSQLVKVTALLGPAKINVSQRVGYFDNNDGLYFQQTSAGLSVCRRTSTSGSPVNNCVAQSSWNLDKLDGTGSSGKIVTDGSFDLIFVIDFEWLSYGRIRWGIDFGDQIVFVHEFTGVGNLTVPTFRTPDLPISWEIENTGTTASSTSMKAVCASVHSEGGTEIVGWKFSATNGTGVTAVTTRAPILTIRPKATFSGITNRGVIWPLTSSGINISNGDAFCEIIRNGTLTGTPVWNSVSTNSIAEYDNSATGITGGDLIDAYGIPGGTANGTPLESRVPLTLSADATTQDTFSFVCTNLTGTTNLKVFLGWKEWR